MKFWSAGLSSAGGLMAAWTSSIAAAHEGHGTPGSGETTWHYLTEPAHAVAGVLAALLLVSLGLAAARWWLARGSHSAQER